MLWFLSWLSIVFHQGTPLPVPVLHLHELMDSWGMSNKVYINTFIIPVMVFNLIKWSVISIVSGITQVKIPSRYLNRCDTTIFKEVYNIDNVKEKEDEYVKG